MYSALDLMALWTWAIIKGQIPWAVFFAAKRDTCPNVNFVWKNNMAGRILKRDKMSGTSETEGEVEYHAF